ncbi:MAG TPA: NADH-quinone oxidoreductase subunit J [Terriglobales bacterium]|nr:NADH-quinone oxidoreductase subunit J [Terriglobales bacterium]
MQLTLFLIFAVVAVAGAVNLLLQRHPIYSALSLVTVMGALAVEYLLLGAEFIAFIQVIVYAGAIMVLFVFVIMVLNAGEVASQPRSKVAALLGLPVLTLLGIILVSRVAGPFQHTPIGLGDFLVQTGPVGQSLFHKFLLPFEVTSVLFLVGVLGAVVLAARREKPALAPPPAEKAVVAAQR